MAAYFWDTSALAKYYHREKGSVFVKTLLETASYKHFISEATLIEMLSVTAAKVRSETDTLVKSDFYMFRKVFQQDVKEQTLLVVKLDPQVITSAQKLIAKPA